VGSIEHFIEEFTYAGVFLVLFVAGLGVPIPEELPVLVSGILAREGLVRWWLALPVCLIGVLTGDASIYWIGRHWGERVLEWRPVRYMLSREREEALKAAYRRHGVKIVFTARHLMGFRAAAFLTAGISRVPFGKFLAVDTAAAMVGVPAGFGLGFLFTDQLEGIMRDVRHFERWLALLALVAIAVWVAIRAYRRSQALERETRMLRDAGPTPPDVL
jgi:membrane protein DedA with SNARE-associated domain